MKKIKIELFVNQEEAAFGEEIEDRLAIILGRLGFKGKIESGLTGNGIVMPVDEEDCTS